MKSSSKLCPVRRKRNHKLQWPISIPITWCSHKRTETEMWCLRTETEGHFLHSYFTKPWTGMEECPEVYQAPHGRRKESRTSEPTTRGLVSGRKVQTALCDAAIGVSGSNGCDKDTEPGTKDGWCGFPCE